MDYASMMIGPATARIAAEAFRFRVAVIAIGARLDPPAVDSLDISLLSVAIQRVAQRSVFGLDDAIDLAGRIADVGVSLGQAIRTLDGGPPWRVDREAE